jgi:hypothetical protein
MSNALQGGTEQLIASGVKSTPRGNIRANTTQGGILGAGTGSQYGAYA